MNTIVLKQSRLFQVLLGAIILVAGAITLVIPTADAASLTSMSLTMSDTRPGQTGVEHTIGFTASGTAIRAIKFEYCTTASGTCTAPTGFDTDTPAITAATTPASILSLWAGNVTSTTNTITISDGAAITDTGFSIIFDDLVNVGTTSDTTATVFFVRISTFAEADATSAVDGTSAMGAAVIPGVSVSGTQDAILAMTVGALPGSTSIDTDPVKSTTDASTATTLPFGTFDPTGPVSKALAQTVTVNTNAATGYSVTVAGDAAAAMTRSGGGGTISFISDNTAWVETGSPTEAFGISAKDGDAPATFDDDGVAGTQEYFSAASGSPLTVASSAVPVSSSATTVIYRVQVAATQAAGTYTGRMDYTTLPNF